MRQLLLSVALCCLPMIATAGVCETGWDGDKIVKSLSGRPSSLRIPLKDKAQNTNEVTLAQIRAFQDAKDRISQVVGLSPTFLICGDRNPNAFASSGPNGEVVGVTIGMLRLVNGDPDMAAAVIGHEFGHHVKRHGESSQTREAIMGAIGLIAGVALEYNMQKKQGIEGVGFQLGQTGSKMVSRKFDRDQEREADDLGFQYMITAGFNPTGSVRLAEKFTQVGEGGGGWFFDSHPGWNERGEIFRTKIANSSDAQRIIAKANSTNLNLPASTPSAPTQSIAFSPSLQVSEAQKSFQLGVQAAQLGKPSEAIEHFKTSAGLDYLPAQWALGVMNEKGQGVPVDLSEAVSWYRKAATKGLPAAMHSLGSLYERGLGVAQNDSEAFSWYSKSAERGYPQSMVALGFMYKNGKGVAKDQAKAFEQYKLASSKNFPFGHFVLSLAYSNGLGVEKNQTEAQSLLIKASDMGDESAQVFLGTHYQHGSFGLEKNPEAAIVLFTKAAEKNNPQAFYLLGGAYESGIGVVKDFDIARDCYLKASKLGIKVGADLAISRINSVAEKKVTKSCLVAPKKVQEESKIAAVANQEQSMRLAFINAQRLMKELGASRGETKEEESKTIERANRIIKSVAEKYEISLVMQDVVWINSSFDITPYVISILKNSAISPPAVLTEKRIRPIKIGYVNNIRLFQKHSIVAEYQRSTAGKDIKNISNPDEVTIARNEKVATIIERANKQIKMYAEENGLDLVLQDVVWVSPGLDITSKIIDKF